MCSTYHKDFYHVFQWCKLNSTSYICNLAITFLLKYSRGYSIIRKVYFKQAKCFTKVCNTNFCHSQCTQHALIIMLSDGQCHSYMNCGHRCYRKSRKIYCRHSSYIAGWYNHGLVPGYQDLPTFRTSILPLGSGMSTWHASYTVPIDHWVGNIEIITNWNLNACFLLHAAC
jgi:hypothetical protein